MGFNTAQIFLYIKKMTDPFMYGTLLYLNISTKIGTLRSLRQVNSKKRKALPQ